MIGLISDTHGLLREQAIAALRGSELIIHAGDVGKPEILAALRELAPVVAVKGNIDKGSWASQLPATQIVQAGPATIYVLHAAAGSGLGSSSGRDSDRRERPFSQAEPHRDDPVLFTSTPGAPAHAASDYR